MEGIGDGVEGTVRLFELGLLDIVVVAFWRITYLVQRSVYFLGSIGV